MTTHTGTAVAPPNPSGNNPNRAHTGELPGTPIYDAPLTEYAPALLVDPDAQLQLPPHLSDRAASTPPAEAHVEGQGDDEPAADHRDRNGDVPEQLPPHVPCRRGSAGSAGPGQMLRGRASPPPNHAW